MADEIVNMPRWAEKDVQTAAKQVVDDTNAKVTSLATDVAAIKADVATLVSRQCEIVVTCATQDGVTVTGQTVTLRAGASAYAPVYDTRAYNGQPVTFQVPKGFRYFIEVSSSLAGHYAPTTAVGTATSNTTAVTLTYSDVSHITTFAALEAAAQSMQTESEGRAALVGIEIPDTWTDNDGVTVYSNPRIVVDVQPVFDPDGAVHLGAILLPKYASKNDLMFDAPENGPEAYASEATAAGGIYYWGYGKDYSQATTYAVNAFCGYKGGVWKCATAVTEQEEFDPTKWTLLDAKAYSSSATYDVGDMVKQTGKVYECTTAISTAEEFNPDHWVQKLATGTFQTGARTALSLASGATVPYSAWTLILRNDVNNIDIQTSGYNNWEFSAHRLWYNSDAALGSWWYAQHVGDCPPDNAALLRGYKAGCSIELLQHAKPIRVPFYPWGLSPQYTIDTFWAPSVTEMFGIANDDEGYAFKAVQDATGWTTANNGANSGRIYRRVSATGTAVNCWCRSPVRYYSYVVWLVGSSGIISANNASSAFAALPACVIY